MRARRTAQRSLFDPTPVDHPVADELERVSALLDECPELLDGVVADLGVNEAGGRGRHGLTRESVLRCAVLLHLRQATCRGLEFLLRDSLTAQRFARVDRARLPGKSALQSTIGAIGAATWERINRRLLDVARAEGIESGARVRVDSTVTETHILAPADSQLLSDGVRVPTRLLGTAREALGAEVVAFHDHCRAAKRRALQISSQRGKDRRAGTCRKLLKIVRQTRRYVAAALAKVAEADKDGSWQSWRDRLGVCDALLERVVDQTRRRVFDGETVPAKEKVASLFEPHTDIIVKGGRGTCHGHKVNLATGRSGLALDAVVEDGNPADSARCLPMLERHVAHCGSAPTHAAFDGGHVSRHNVETARELGVRHAVFHKKRGVKPQDMTPSSWVYAQLKRFRAGVEAGISCLKRCFGLGRCHWRGLAHFKAYVQSAAVAHNLVRLARLRPSPG